MKRLIAVFSILIMGMFILPAAAADDYTQGDDLPLQAPCTPRDAYSETIPGTPPVPAVYQTVVVEEAGWQRYSYNGPWEHNDVPPPFPGELWQPNVKGDPHGVGQDGAYFRSNGNSGKGDWFYLERTPEVTELVLVSPEIPGTPDVIVDYPAVVCPDEPEPPVVVPPVIDPPVVEPPVVVPPVILPPEPKDPNTFDADDMYEQSQLG